MYQPPQPPGPPGPPQPPGPPGPPGYPQGYPPQPGYGQPPGMPPPQKNNATKPLLIGCGVLVLILLVGGGIASWLVVRAVSPIVHGASEAAQVAQGAVQGAQQEAAQAGSSPDPEHAAAAGVAVLKSLVGGGKAHVETLSRDELKTYLPASAASLPRTASDSSKNSFGGISGTNASATYSSGTTSVDLEITDAANMAGLTSFMDLMMNGISSEDDSGFEKTVQLGDVKVHEKWTNASKHAELIGIVGGRFAVSVESNGVDMATAEQAFQAVDIAKLESVPAPK